MKKRKPKPGSKPFKYIDVPPDWKEGDPIPEQWTLGGKRPKWMEDTRGPFDPDKVELPSWMTEAGQEANKKAERDMNLSALGKARAKVEELAGDVRSDAFNDWVQRCVVTAQVPSEWTQARVLYENYLAHVKTYGRRAAFRALSIQEAATETQWGRMMATLFLKKRRTAGWYYQLRCKRT